MRAIRFIARHPGLYTVAYLAVAVALDRWIRWTGPEWVATLLVLAAILGWLGGLILLDGVKQDSPDHLP